MELEEYGESVECEETEDQSIRVDRVTTRTLTRRRAQGSADNRNICPKMEANGKKLFLQPEKIALNTKSNGFQQKVLCNNFPYMVLIRKADGF